MFEIASHSRQHLSDVIRYAIHQGLTGVSPTADFDGVTASPARWHYPTLPLEHPPESPEWIDNYHQGRELTRPAILLTLHVFIRSNELHYIRWTEINFGNRAWIIPATREAIADVHCPS